jgi:serine protease
MHRGHVALTVLAFLLLSGTVCSLGAGKHRKFQSKPNPVSAMLEMKTGQRFVPGEVICKRKPGVPRSLSAEQISPLGFETEARLTSGGEVIYRIGPTVMTTLSEKDKVDRTLAAVKAVQAMPDVEYAQPNYIRRVVSTTPSDPLYPQQWHYFTNGTGAGKSLGGISLPNVWDTNKGSSSVVVAVIDTGILPNHPDIVGSPNLLAGYDMISDPSMANDGDGRDPDPTDPGDAIAAGECGGGFPPVPEPNSWHGTHVSGTVGVGNTNNGIGVAGINWNVKVQPVRVLGKCGGTTSDIIDAIRWAAALPVPGVPNNPTKARVINMSLGGEGACSADPATQSAINDAFAQGVTVVVAAGNSQEDASLETPAGCDNVIAVAASDARGFLVTRYSNFGPTVKIMAPGGDVQRDDNGDGNPDGVLSMISPADGTYAYYNGTSMAAPHVAGVVALLLASNPNLTPTQVLARLQSTALPRNSTQCPQPCGAGLLNAEGAILGSNPPVSFSLTLAPSSLSLRRSGGSKTAVVAATVLESGTPKAGETVTFTSDNPSIATVSPGSATTDSAGHAQATVTAQQKGDTQVHASAQGAGGQSSVHVPTLADWAIALLALGPMLVYLWKRRRLRRRFGPTGSARS